MSIKSRKPKTYKKKTYSKTPKVSLTVKKYVKQAIHASIENKQWVNTVVNSAINTANGTTPFAINLIPDTLTQGVGQFQRIANEITCIKGILRIKFNYLPYNIATNPQSAPLYLKYWLVSSKKI